MSSSIRAILASSSMALMLGSAPTFASICASRFVFRYHFRELFVMHRNVKFLMCGSASERIFFRNRIQVIIIASERKSCAFNSCLRAMVRARLWKSCPFRLQNARKSLSVIWRYYPLAGRNSHKRENYFFIKGCICLKRRKLRNLGSSPAQLCPSLRVHLCDGDPRNRAKSNWYERSSQRQRPGA
jgi:hypothetical protein